MKKLSIPFTITYQESYLSPAERHPELICYLDRRFDREPTHIKLKCEQGALHEGKVEGNISRAVKVYPANTSICFQALSWRGNEFGDPCELDNGIAFVSLEKVAEAIKRDGVYSEEILTRMYVAQGVAKHKFNLTITADQFKQIQVGPTPIRGNVGDDLKNYTDYVMQLEQKMEDTLEGTERMRLPFYFGETGFQTPYPLPSVAYLMYEIPKSNANYWINAFQTVMRRDGVESFRRLNKWGKARATILTICYAAQWLDYVGDTIDRNTKFQRYARELVEAYENFGDALSTWSGDCEDLACAIMQCYYSFLAQEIPELKELQEIARQYVPVMSLDIVKGAQVSDQVNSYGAHMNVNFVPLNIFESWLNAYRSNWGVVNRDFFKIAIDGYCFLVGEGTGMYEPLGYQNLLIPLMMKIYRLPSLERFKKPILHIKGEPGNFFVGSLVGMTDYFYRFHNARAPMSFWYTTNGKRGATYVDMMNDKQIGIKLHPEIPGPLVDYMEEETLKRIPPNPLILTKKDKKHTNKILDKICAAINKLDRAHGLAHNKVPVFVRPHQLSARLGDAIIRELTQVREVWRVTYELEEITDKVWGYRMEIYA